MVYYGENNFEENDDEIILPNIDYTEDINFEPVHKFINYGNLWNDPNVPKNNWECRYVYDLGVPSGTCEMCGKNIIRYVHVMKHKNYHDLHVGCVCAGNMEGDVEEAKKRENRFKNKEIRKANFKNKKWKKSYAGNEYLRIKGHVIVIFRDFNTYGYSIDGKYSINSYKSRDDLIDYIFEVVDEF